MKTPHVLVVVTAAVVAAAGGLSPNLAVAGVVGRAVAQPKALGLPVVAVAADVGAGADVGVDGPAAALAKIDGLGNTKKRPPDNNEPTTAADSREAKLATKEGSEQIIKDVAAGAILVGMGAFLVLLVLVIKEALGGHRART